MKLIFFQVGRKLLVNWNRGSRALPVRLWRYSVTLPRVSRNMYRVNPPGLSPADRRLGAHEVVIGLAVNGAAKAYPLAALRAEKVITDRLGGEEVVLEYHAFGERVSAHDRNGAALRFERQWWLAWSEFHPRSAIYGSI